VEQLREGMVGLRVERRSALLSMDQVEKHPS
jgi:hypothetical protein